MLLMKKWNLISFFLTLLTVNLVQKFYAKAETSSCPEPEYIKTVLQEWDQKGRPKNFRRGWHLRNLPLEIDFEKLLIKYQSRYHYDGNEYCRYSWQLGKSRDVIAILK